MSETFSPPKFTFKFYLFQRGKASKYFNLNASSSILCFGTTLQILFQNALNFRHIQFKVNTSINDVTFCSFFLILLFAFWKFRRLEFFLGRTRYLLFVQNKLWEKISKNIDPKREKKMPYWRSCARERFLLKEFNSERKWYCVIHVWNRPK